MQKTVRLNFDFPRKEHMALKIILASKGVTFTQFATELLMKELEAHKSNCAHQGKIV